MRFSLQDMVRQTLADVDRREQIKLAQAEEENGGNGGDEEKPDDKKEKEKKQGPPAAAKSPPPPNNTNTAPERNEESYEEKTSSAFVEKLASAVAFCNEHFLQKEAVGKPEPSKSHTPPTADTGLGAGKGTGSLETNVDSPTAGMQSEETGQATGQQVPATNPPSDPSSPGQTNPSTALQTTIQERPGGSEDWTNKDVQKQASARAAQIARVRGIMAKMAADSVNPASIGAKTTNPHQSSPEGVSAAGEGGKPSVPGEVSKQESMVGSNESATNYTKQQAKAVPKARMGEVLDEPAQKKSTDPVLHQNLDAASGAGVKLSSVSKVAAARALLQKVAEEGAKPDASPEEKERASKLQDALKAKEEEKKQKASMGMPMGGGY